MLLQNWIATFESWIGAFVHASARLDREIAGQHRRLLMLRLAMGVVGLASLPGYLVSAGPLGAPQILVALGLLGPLASFVVLSRTGQLVAAQIIASMALVVLFCSLAIASGGLRSPMSIALAAVPFEALMSGHPASIFAAVAMALAGMAVIAVADATGMSPTLAPGLPSIVPFLAVAALVQAATLAVISGFRRAAELSERRITAARSRIVLDSVSDMVVWLDRAGQVGYVNAAAGHILGVGLESLTARGLFEKVHVADRPLYLKAVSDAAHSDKPVTVNFRTVVDGPEGANGAAVRSVRWLEMRAQRAVGESEAVGAAAVVAVIRDETERRAIEEQREQARVDAQHASEVKGRFLATVSHELRTPLNAIIGFSEMLGTESISIEDSQRREYARIIQTSGEHLLEVVNALLDISKIESGAMTIEPDQLDIGRLVVDCCDLMELRSAEKGIVLERVVTPSLPPMQADKRALKQVLLNLLSNAVKFTPSGGRIVVAAVRDGDFIDLSVSDTGIGIAETDLPRLGDAFFQAKSSYDRQYEGTGLGLSVVRGLVGLHGGTISIESAPGQGTRVAARLPIEGAVGSVEAPRIITFAKAPRRQLRVIEDRADVAEDAVRRSA